ncbi:MAG: S8 family serine peptidase, partial [Anaerolineaceae bacterium]|nr:S8 family serine peptidase [Anaerolineaceae bacterium]
MKSKLSQLFALLMIISLALSSVSSVTAAAPASSGDPGSKYKAEDAVSRVIGEVADDTEPARYIIFLPDEPLATYTGGTAGLDATAPRETGQKLSLESAAVVAYQDYLKSQQASYIAEVKAKLHRSPEVLFRYQYAANGVAMILTPSEAAILAQQPGVRVFRAPIETPDTDTGPGLIGAGAIWDGSGIPDGIGNKGEGVIVGIIDTGINFDHPSFSDTPADAYIYPAPAQYYGVCDSTNAEQYDADYATACNDKLIGAFTFVRGDPDESETPEDSEGHGSHTASTVAGNTVDVDYQGVATTISGVAPHAQIISFDVCVPTPPNGACYGDATVEAVDAALETGVDVINYSISGGSNPYADPVELAFLSATEAGIFVSTSAGNAGDTTGESSVAHRSPWVSTVAAATHNRIFASEADITGPDVVPSELTGLGVVQSGPVLISDLIDLPVRYDSSNLTGCSAFSAGFFSGSIALIARGDCTFAAKEANAYAAGATYVL